MSALGDGDMKDRMLTEAPFGEGNEPVHLGGYDFMPYFRGDSEQGLGLAFMYFSDGGGLMNLRYNRWKFVFDEQRTHGFDGWQEPLSFLRLPKIIDLYADPFERAEHESIGYAW